MFNDTPQSFISNATASACTLEYSPLLYLAIIFVQS